MERTRGVERTRGRDESAGQLKAEFRVGLSEIRINHRVPYRYRYNQAHFSSTINQHDGDNGFVGGYSACQLGQLREH